MVTYSTGYEEVTPSGKLSKEYLERVHGNTGCPVWIPRTIKLSIPCPEAEFMNVQFC